jgi:hypothetical protein
MDTPKNPKHKSIVLARKYFENDGKYANETDAMSLSIGLAQWENSENDISAKVFRRKNGKWLRQSEELPLHRVLDLSILLIASLTKNAKNLDSITRTSLNEEVVNTESLVFIEENFQKDQENLTQRIKELESVIATFRKKI